MGESMDLLRQSQLLREVDEDCELSLPDGDKKVLRAWYGDPRAKWKEAAGQGMDCTARVKELLRTNGHMVATNEALEMDPAPGKHKVLLVQLISPGLEVCTCEEHGAMLIPGGAENVLQAWYGDPAWQWQEGPRVGVSCADVVREQLRRHGRVSASNDALCCDPAPGVHKSLAVQVADASLRLCACQEHEVLDLPSDAAPDGLHRAWYGDPAQPWQLGEGRGKSCLEHVKELMRVRGSITVSNSAMGGDPAPSVLKVLLVEVRMGELADQREAGPSRSPQRASSGAEAEEGEMCVVCLDACKTHAFTPCGHRCACGACSRTVLASSHPRCPVCRARTSSAMQIFV